MTATATAQKQISDIQEGLKTPTTSAQTSIDTGSFFGLVKHTCARLIDAMRDARTDYIAGKALASLDFSTLIGTKGIEELQGKLEACKAGLSLKAANTLDESFGKLGKFHLAKTEQIKGKYEKIASILERAGFTTSDKQDPTTWPDRSSLEKAVAELPREKKREFVQAIPELKDLLGDLETINSEIELAHTGYVGATLDFVEQVRAFEESDVFKNSSDGAKVSFSNAVDVVGQELANRLAPILDVSGTTPTSPSPEGALDEASAALSRVTELVKADHDFRSSSEFHSLGHTAKILYSSMTDDQEVVYGALCMRETDSIEKVLAAANRGHVSLECVKTAASALEALETSGKDFLASNSGLHKKANGFYGDAHQKIISDLGEKIETIIRGGTRPLDEIDTAVNAAIHQARAEATSAAEKATQLSDVLTRADEISKKLDATVAHLERPTAGSTPKSIEQGKVYVHLSDEVADALLNWVEAERNGPQIALNQALASSPVDQSTIDAIVNSVETLEETSTRIHGRLNQVGRELFKISKKTDRNESNLDPFKDDSSMDVVVKRMTTTDAFRDAGNEAQKQLTRVVKEVFSAASKPMKKTIIDAFKAETARINSGGTAPSTLSEALKPLEFYNKALATFEQRMQAETDLRTNAESILEEVAATKQQLIRIQKRAEEIAAWTPRAGVYGKQPTWADFE
jgi:hypothetical protein